MGSDPIGSDPGKVMIVAGESSGDLHGGHLARALQTARPNLKLFGLGGSAMREAGVEILADPTRIAVIGLVEVIQHLPAFRKLFRQAVQALDERRPDLVVLIDYPGFNLRFAREVKRRGIRLLYYISPQIWAWDPGRIHAIKRLVDRMLVVFPFEKEMYERHGVPVTFVGHPLIDQVKPTLTRLETLQRLGLEEGLPIVGLLPGSREVEVRRILPPLLGTAERMQEKLPSTARFLLIKAPHLPWKLYREILDRSSLKPKVVERWDYDGIYACDLVLVASGTATLECALLERPMLILYKTSWPTYLVSRLAIRIPMIGLVNVLAGEKVAPEFIQHRANPEAIARAALELWGSADRRDAMKAAFRKIRQSLGAPGASDRAAQAVLAELRVR
ncbi:MAG: lipid-A-disaccharide synthase [Candidatus Omnitrophica bacterium]|nr:lipid-A-disaccharide synthase [Candidatus Omnitrophota bacterium]